MSGSLDRRTFLEVDGRGRRRHRSGQRHRSSPMLAAEKTRRRCSRFRWPSGRFIARCSTARWTTSISPRRQARLRHRRVEYVNQFFKDKAKDTTYLTELKKRCDDHGVTSVLIMSDDEGDLGDPDDAKRTKAVENHYKWVEAAKFLGCHSIRVNARSTGAYDEQMKLAADGLRRLSEFGAKHDIERDRREPRRPVVERRVAGRRDEDGRPDRTAARCPTSATSASATTRNTTATRASRN